MLPYHNDYQFRIDYDPQNNKFGFKRNTIGAHSYETIDVASITYTDANSIFVSDTTGDDGTGNGTQAAPYKTILFSCNQCTASKTYVIVLDSVLYSEELDLLDNEHFAGLYAATGQTPTLSLRVLDYTENDANTIFVSKTGLDSNAGTRAAPKLTLTGATGAISAVTAGKQSVMIDDSETYNEDGFEFTGNFKNLRAKIGEAPTVSPGFNNDFFTVSNQVAKTTIEASNVRRASGCTVLENGKIVLLYDNTSSFAGVFKILGADYSTLVSSTTYYDPVSQVHSGSVVELDNGNFIIFYTDANAGLETIRYQVRNQSGGVETSDTVLLSGDRFVYGSCVFQNGNILLSIIDSSDGNKAKYMVIDQDFNTVKSLTTFHSASTSHCDVCLDADENVYFVYSDNADSNKGKYVILESTTWTEIKSETEFDANYVTGVGCRILENGLFLICYWEYTGATENVNYLILETDTYTEVISQTLIENFSPSTSQGRCAVDIALNGDIFFYYSQIVAGANTASYYETFRPDLSSIKVSVDVIINGIIFNVGHSNSLSKYIDCSSSLVGVSWCTFDEIGSSTSNQSAWCIYSDDEVNVDHCSVHDSDKGVYTETNNSVIEENEFYRISEGYALHIKGAAVSSGDITVEHNTFFNCYSALYLDDNGGSAEVVKNCIFLDSGIYDINADTSMTFTYSTYTGTLNNATSGTGVIKSNPLFVDDGSLVEDNTDLKIKLRVLGYPADSPAYLLADETSPDRDAGSWDVIPIGEETTYTSITIEKPSTGIKVSHEFIGAIVTRKRDGDVETDYDDVMELLEFKFTGIMNADYNNLMDMLTCGNNEIRLYPDPTTHPNSYNSYKVIYENVSSAVKQFRLSRTGVQDFGFALARAYE